MSGFITGAFQLQPVLAFHIALLQQSAYNKVMRKTTIIISLTLIILLVGVFLIKQFKLNLKPSISLLPLTLGCPVPQPECKQGKSLEVNLADGQKTSFSLGWKLASGSAVLAVFDGTIRTKTISGGDAFTRLISLTSNNKLYQADYLFSPEGMSPLEQTAYTKEVAVKKGDQLSFVSGKTLDVLGRKGVTLEFTLIDLKKGERIPGLSADNFD